MFAVYYDMRVTGCLYKQHLCLFQTAVTSRRMEEANSLKQ